MLLSAKMYEDIIRCLRSDGSKTERRHHPRVGLRARITIITINAQGVPAKPETVWVRDLSDGGIGLVATRVMRRGTLFVVQFSGHDTDALALLCQAVQSRE